MKRTLASLFVAATVLAGGRAHYGGTLQVCVVAEAPTADPLLADTPTAAALLSLTNTPLCRLAEVSRPTQATLRLELAEQVAPAAVVQLLQRVQHSRAPISALLEGVTRIAEAGRAVELTNAPAELERALCHPAFSLPIGPFRPSPRGLVAVTELPEGRPYVDQIAVTLSDARAADRLLAQRRVNVVVGAVQPDSAPQLFVLSLVFSPHLGAHLRTALDSSIDRANLALFVLQPSAPMFGLLPAALGGPATALARPPRPAPISPEREVTLWFDVTASDELAIAQKLQLKLQPLGYRVALKGVARDELRSHVLVDNELAMVSTLLPPSPSQAAAVMLALSGQRQRIPQLRSTLTSLDPDAAARAFSLAALPDLPLFPLATRGLAVTTTPDVQHLTRDALGLPRLDDVFLSNE